MSIFPKLSPEIWITSPLPPEEIRQQLVWIELKGGQKRLEQFEIDDMNGRGELLVRINYNSSPFTGTLSPDSYRVTQQELDSWIADKDVVLKV